jgi:hypothetical protein
LFAAAAASSSTVFARFASGAAVEKGEEFEEEAAAEVLVVDAEEAARRGNRFRVPFPRSDMLPGDGRFELPIHEINSLGEVQPILAVKSTLSMLKPSLIDECSAITEVFRKP